MTLISPIRFAGTFSNLRTCGPGMDNPVEKLGVVCPDMLEKICKKVRTRYPGVRAESSYTGSPQNFVSIRTSGNNTLIPMADCFILSALRERKMEFSYSAD